ncbi:MAG: hypothetical protein HYY46_12190, partial [Deltaproteobacteria bacterium]|nr:hypothetical protein [Deltaproteobacteria bacterium]
HIFDLDNLVEGLSDDNLKLPLSCAFTRGDFLYNKSNWSLIFQDRDIQQLIVAKFEDVSKGPWVVHADQLEQSRIGIQDSPFGTIHDDLGFYRNEIYALTEQGLFRVATHKPKKNKFKVDRRADKIWDGRGSSLQPGGGGVAIAAANDGLFEYTYQSPRGVRTDPLQLTNRHTMFVNWAFASIYASSDLAPGFLAAYGWRDVEGQNAERQRERIFKRMCEEDEIFGDFVEPSLADTPNLEHLSWGAQEKLYLIQKDLIRAIRFTQKRVGSDPGTESPFQLIEDIELNIKDMGNPVWAGTAYYGVIIEFDTAVVVICSNGDRFYICGPIVRWRVFPRSQRYE